MLGLVGIQSFYRAIRNGWIKIIFSETFGTAKSKYNHNLA